jgi:hypothetical protein
MSEDPAEREQAMAAWNSWFTEIGSSLVDPGAPTGAAKTVGAGGSVSDGGSRGLNGYSVITAESIDHAVAAAKMCPLIAGGGTVDVYETIEM